MGGGFPLLEIIRPNLLPTRTTNPPADGARGGDPGAGGNEPKQEPRPDGGTPLPGNDQAGQPRDAEPEADPAQVNGAAGLLQPAAGHADDQQGDGHQAEPLIDFQPVPARPPQPELGGGMRPNTCKTTLCFNVGERIDRLPLNNLSTTDYPR